MYIGIIGRKNDDKITFNKEIIDVIKKYDFIPLGIIVDFENNSDNEFIKTKPLIDLCSGIVLQGGSDYYDIDIIITKYLHKNNIPTLGICLGMQTMAMAFNGNMGDINNHKSDKLYVHSVDINKNSKLYDILKKDKIMVNSRHKSYIINTDNTRTNPNYYSNSVYNNGEGPKEKDGRHFEGAYYQKTKRL